jgi:predicted transcriptional regulator
MSDTPGAAPARSLVTKIVSGYVSKNQIVPADMPTLIATVHQSLLSLGKSTEPEPSPAIPIRRSVTPNYVVCLECGWRAKTLRRHLQVRHGLSPNQYRVQWKLSPDHPITAPAYSARRSAFARQIGLGQKPIGRRGRRQAPQRPPA